MEYLRLWKYWIRPLVFSIYILLLLVAVPLCIWELVKKDAEKHVVAWFVGGLFVMMALPISFLGILQHLIFYTVPNLQRHVVRILWMVPVYALNAWLGLRFPHAAIYLDTLRECYEAYVIYNFMSYLLVYLKSEHPDLDLVLEVKPRVKHIFPFCCFPLWPMGGSFIQKCKHGVFQYTIIRPTTTIIALICELSGVYDEGDFNFKTAWSYIVIINNISQVWAMYCLIMFYRGTKEELKPINPVPKFMCVKAVVFLSFWQAVIIAALVKLGVIKNQTWVFYTVKDVATGIQDFLICIEMFLAAIAHYFSFSHKPYMGDSTMATGNCCSSFLSMWDVSDVRDDVIEHVRYLGNNVKKTVGIKKPSSQTFYTKENLHTERIPLLQVNSETERNRSASYSESDHHYSPIVFQEKMSTDLNSDRSDLNLSFEASSEISRIVDENRDFEKSVSPSLNNFLENSISSSQNQHVYEDAKNNVGANAHNQITDVAQPLQTVAVVHSGNEDHGNSDQLAATVAHRNQEDDEISLDVGKSDQLAATVAHRNQEGDEISLDVDNSDQLAHGNQEVNEKSLLDEETHHVQDSQITEKSITQ